MQIQTIITTKYYYSNAFYYPGGIPGGIPGSFPGGFPGGIPGGFPAGFPGFGFMDREETVSDSELPDLLSEDGHSDNEQENNPSDNDELPDLGLAL